MNIKEVLIQAAKKLKEVSTSPDLDSEVLLSFVLGKPKEYLFTYPKRSLNQQQTQKFNWLMAKRARQVPVAYLVGKKNFFGLDFMVNKDVLVPRSLTESLVEKAVEYLKGKNGLRILDVGTGSGSIIISLAYALGKKHKYFASDISNKSLEVAKENAKKHKVNVIFKKSDLLANWQQDFDVIIANLPYLGALTSLSTKHEPIHALISSKQGLDHYQRLIKQISAKPPLMRLFVEVGRNHPILIKKLAAKYIPGTPMTIINE